MKKIFKLLTALCLTLGIVSCNKPGSDNPTPGPTPVDPTPVDPTPVDPTPVDPTPVKKDVKIGIKGASEVKSKGSITMRAETSNFESDGSVTWSLKGEGASFASIDPTSGVLTAKEVDTVHTVEVVATSNENTSSTASKIITILCKPSLTQSMFDALNVDTIGFEGYENINLYTIPENQLYGTYVSALSTSMNGTNWYARYVDTTGIPNSIYYKNVDGICCQVGVSLLNEEQYEPMLDDFDHPTTFIDSGLYNSLKGLTVSDFAFNEETWSYEYVGSKDKMEKIILSANPYDFIPEKLSLIVDENEILGIRSIAKPDYSIVEGYSAIQELIMAINTYSTVSVPTIGKYSHEDIHDDINAAVANMKALDSYTVDYLSASASIYSSSTSVTGFKEEITSDLTVMTDYEVAVINGDYSKKYDNNSIYGFKKIDDGLYNAYFADMDNSFNLKASRAYEKDFKTCLPSFDFAGEIFRSYIQNDDGSTTYYVDEVMSQVATTFYFGVGTDINMYGIYASDGHNFTTSTFTPYITIKDGYIVEAGFYYYMYYIYGLITLTYSDFNSTTIDREVEFTTRQVPSSYDELTMFISEEGVSSTDDTEVNMSIGLREYFEDDTIVSKIPFLGNSSCLGDTFGFALTTTKLDNTGIAKKAVVMYYDVPLDIDYSIDTSLKAVNNLLLSQGFTKNAKGEYRKDGIVCQPVDNNLDFMFYVWVE